MSDFFTIIKDYAELGTFLVGLGVPKSINMVKNKILSKKIKDIELLKKEINDLINFSDSCANILEECSKNEETIQTWLNRTRSLSLHSSYNDFVNISSKLNKPNNIEIQEILVAGKQIRQYINQTRNQLKQELSSHVTQTEIDIWIRMLFKIRKIYNTLNLTKD
ncbi:hypothetical protein [Neisseria sp. HMSC064E01]|uniref:hypothetical protein n=1 Tax=Neisseria sp. HMSC064E01 TaxID=1715052 RepID=UPI0008A483BA|nr:hypothetical protein [Neisseria sp. HMSC064E01]OFN77199.1 hypothetical protein HMPREF2572_09570 [Neisseria sp. HMSC064E01]